MRVIEPKPDPKFKTVAVQFENGEVEALIDLCRRNVSIPELFSRDHYSGEYRSVAHLLDKLHNALDSKYQLEEDN